MPVEKVRIEPERMVLKNSDGSVAFDTNNNYIRTDVVGNFSLQQVGAVPIPTSTWGDLQNRGANAYYVRMHLSQTPNILIYPPFTTDMEFSSDGYLIINRFYHKGGDGIPRYGITDPSDVVHHKILINGTSVLETSLDVSRLFVPDSGTGHQTGALFQRRIIYSDSSRLVYNDGYIIKVRVFAGETITYTKIADDTLYYTATLVDLVDYQSDEQTLPLALSK